MYSGGAKEITKHTGSSFLHKVYQKVKRILTGLFPKIKTAEHSRTQTMHFSQEI